jgi:hypothetical protein
MLVASLSMVEAEVVLAQVHLAVLVEHRSLVAQEVQAVVPMLLVLLALLLAVVEVAVDLVAV